MTPYIWTTYYRRYIKHSLPSFISNAPPNLRCASVASNFA